MTVCLLRLYLIIAELSEFNTLDMFDDDFVDNNVKSIETAQL